MRRLCALIEGLPPDAALWRRGRIWTDREELLAGQIESADSWFRILARGFGYKGNELPKPPQITHPDRHRAEPVKRKPEQDPGAIRRFFDRL